ncbi:MAG: hypothetical protein ABI183_10435 [Polyangiaceae bacterium]
MKKISIGFVMLAGCASADPPAVHAPNPANASAPIGNAPPAAGMARVVLIRPESQCDSSAYPIVVDESGHFVGEISQNSQASVDMPAGEHTLFAWPSVDARVEKYSDFDPVGVVTLHLKAGDTRYVEVIIPQRLAAQCWHITTFGLRRIAATDSDLREWLATTKPITIDRAVGEAELARDPALVQTHIASGKRELEQGRTLRDERADARHPPAATDSTDTK